MSKRKLILCVLAATLVACGDKPAEKKGAPPTLITTTQARIAALETSERTLGTLEALADPKISAEIAGRVIEVAVHSGQSVRKGQLLARIDPTDISHQSAADQAEASRLQALLAQQERLVVRQTELLQKNFISKNALDDVSAQRDALKGQLDAAQARAAISGNGINKTRVSAPVDGVIEAQIVSPGDYIKLGDPLFNLVSNKVLRAHLPFPEASAARLKIGQQVRLRSPLDPAIAIEGLVEEMKPTLSEGSRAIDVMVRLQNPGFLKGGSSVDATVITGRRENAILVLEQAVVLRPAGRVVYVIAEGKATQKIVEIGSKQNGLVEIRSGLQGGETLALDGAGFLSNNAAISVKDKAPASQTPATPAAPSPPTAKPAQ